MLKEFFKPSFSFRGLLMAFAGLAAVFTVMSFMGRVWWPFELGSHFRLQYFLFFLAIALAFVVGRKAKEAAAFGILSFINLVFILPLYINNPPAEPCAKTYRAVLMNVNRFNRQFEKAREFIESTDPDFMVVIEVNDVWAQELSVLGKDYPYSKVFPRDGCFGLLLYSRFPIRSAEVRETGELGVATIFAKLDLDGRPLTVVGAHSLPPRGRIASNHRNRHMEHLASMVSSIQGKVMLLGDLNMTSWSPAFKDFINDTGLRDGRAGFGLQTTWPSYLPFPGITIDHCLVSPQIKIHGHQTGPDIGSDHYPVVVDFCVD